MNIPQEAIDAILHAIAPGIEDACPEEHESYTELAREVAEAAFPVLAAHVLRVTARQAEHDSPDDGVSPYWLRVRAAEYREGKPTPSIPPVSCRCEFGWQPECPHHGTDTK